MLFVKALRDKIAALGYDNVEVSIIPTVSLPEVTDTHIFVIPTALTTDIETRDSLHETMAAQILVCRYIKSIDPEAADEVFDTVTNLHYALLAEFVEIENQCPYFIKQVKEYGSTFVGSSGQMDGLYDTEAVDENYFLKCPIVVEAIRRLQNG